MYVRSLPIIISRKQLELLIPGTTIQIRLAYYIPALSFSLVDEVPKCLFPEETCANKCPLLVVTGTRKDQFSSKGDDDFLAHP